MMIENFSFDGLKAQSDEANLSIGRGVMEAVYGTNDAGRPYARKARFVIDTITVRPVGANAKLRAFLTTAGVSAEGRASGPTRCR